MKVKALTSVLLLSFLIVALTLVSAQAQEATITVTKTVDPTNVYVAGSGLNPEWFEVTIEATGFGGEQTQTDVPIDVIFAIDSSGSMGWNDPSDLRLTAAKTFVDLLLDDHQAGVVSWDSYVNFVFPLTYTDAAGKIAVKNQIDNIDSSGGTSLNAGLNGAITALDANTRAGSSVEVIVFLSDGDGTYTYASSGGPASVAASKGYTVYTIGLSMAAGSTPEQKLQDIATATGGTYYASPTADNLQDIFDEIFETVIISTAPTDVDVHEITQDYIIDESTFSIAPTSVTENPDGTTYIFWEDVGDNPAVGDGADPLTASETFTVTFMAKCNTVGSNLPVDLDVQNDPPTYPDPSVTYTDPSGSAKAVPIPQAYINVAEGGVGGGSIVLSPLEATNLVGSPHTVTAVVQDDTGAPIVGQAVTFEVIAGPHAGVTGQAVTDSTGTARFIYIGTSLGTDTIQASFTNGQGQAVTSNAVTKTWNPIDQVIPEVPLGTVVGLGSMILAFSIYFAMPKIRGKKTSL